MSPARCSVDGCDREHKGHGKCQAHLRRGGKPGRIRVYQPGRPCSVAGCDDDVRAHNLCPTHYMATWRGAPIVLRSDRKQARQQLIQQAQAVYLAGATIAQTATQLGVGTTHARALVGDAFDPARVLLSRIATLRANAVRARVATKPARQPARQHAPKQVVPPRPPADPGPAPFTTPPRWPTNPAAHTPEGLASIVATAINRSSGDKRLARKWLGLDQHTFDRYAAISRRAA